MFFKIILTLFLTLLGLRPLISAKAEPAIDIAFSFLFITISCLLIYQRLIPVRKYAFFSSANLFFLAVFISLLFSKNKDLSLTGLYPFMTYFFCYLAVLHLEPAENKLLVKTLILSSAFVSFSALKFILVDVTTTINYLKEFPTTLNSFALEYLGRGRAFVPFPTPTALAGYLILFVPLAFVLVVNNTHRDSPGPEISLKNILRLFIFMLLTLALLATQSLGALLSLILALGFCFLWLKPALKKNLLFLALVFLGGAFLALFWWRQAQPLSFNLPTYSLTARLSYWQSALKNILQHPWVGFGLANYPSFKTIAAHNTYLQLWTEMGILGILGFLTIAIQAARSGIVIFQKNKNPLLWALWCGHLAFLLHNSVDFTFFYPEITLQWWALVALLIAPKDKINTL